MTSTLPPLVQAFSGAIGSATANAIAYPLDLVATRLQTTSSKKLRGLRGILFTLQHILRTEGCKGLYDGLVTDTAATFLSNFLYFYFYTIFRSFLVRRKVRISPPQSIKNKGVPVILDVSEELGVGFLAGVASRAIAAPLNLVTVRLQTETEGEDEEGNLDAVKDNTGEADRARRPWGIFFTVKKIYEDEGLQGFWDGFTATVPLCLNPAITLFLFQIYRKATARYAFRRGAHVQTRSQKLATPNAVSAFIGAACANSIAIVLLYPLILAKTRLQMHRRNGEDENMVSVWRRALQREGTAGVYQGLDAQIMKGFHGASDSCLIPLEYEMARSVNYTDDWNLQFISGYIVCCPDRPGIGEGILLLAHKLLEERFYVNLY
ncbi:hypothetical protein NM688_g4600 [Phlebia brevispora]|uniref:Uncharacterized protein n=1 Tax=Phlebia brevispora TaxID=194682 RepID=A0ACC1T2P1_9APHY|nr:hypothetical protein NM688_g4600 [Phlebia brevispora]